MSNVPTSLCDSSLTLSMAIFPGGEKHHHNLLGFHLPHLSHGKKEASLPKGCMAVRVGPEGEQQRKFVVPVAYLNHPLFMRLLKKSEEVYGFEQQGAITLPCCVEDFWHVRDVIDRESGAAAAQHHHYHHHHHRLHLAGCFRA